MNVEYFNEVEYGQSFIGYNHTNDTLGWYARLIEPTEEYNAVSLDDGSLYLFKDTGGVVLERNNEH